jgi:hypothetical protein
MDTHYDCVTEDVALSVKSYADIDSVLGRSDSIPFKAQASLYPLANFKYTLTKPVHLEYRVLKGDKASLHIFTFDQERSVAKSCFNCFRNCL